MQIEALVIRTQPWHEHDRLVTLYSRQHGKCTAIAKGSLKRTSKQSLALDSGTLLQCELVPGRAGMAIITGAQALACWHGAKTDPSAWAVAQFFLETVQAVMFDEEPDDHVWQILTGTLVQLEEGTPPLSVLRTGQARLLEALGYGRQEEVTAGPYRTSMDDAFERIAQRKLVSLGTLYSMARG